MTGQGYVCLRGTGKGYKVKVKVDAIEVGKNIELWPVNRMKDGIHFSDYELLLNGEVELGNTEKVDDLMNGTSVIIYIYDNGTV